MCGIAKRGFTGSAAAAQSHPVAGLIGLPVRGFYRDIPLHEYSGANAALRILDDGDRGCMFRFDPVSCLVYGNQSPRGTFARGDNRLFPVSGLVRLIRQFPGVSLLSIAKTRKCAPVVVQEVNLRACQKLCPVLIAE